MSNPRRFPLSYDADFDKDIEELITSTPKKRISERLRYLIRLGLKIEANSATTAPAFDVEPRRKEQQEQSSSVKIAGPAQDNRTRRPLDFQPPE